MQNKDVFLVLDHGVVRRTPARDAVFLLNRAVRCIVTGSMAVATVHFVGDGKNGWKCSNANASFEGLHFHEWIRIRPQFVIPLGKRNSRCRKPFNFRIVSMNKRLFGIVTTGHGGARTAGRRDWDPLIDLEV
jgi:hypothetical protein